MICLQGSQSIDTPVGCDSDKRSKSKPVSTCGHLVIYTKFTSLHFNLTFVIVHSISEMGTKPTALPQTCN